ncbi:MAG: hypothetical protein JST39_11950 [Bacteroidetes bacterium]|nr:hypothetical protein [Bacteroidota bacterium]
MGKRFILTPCILLCCFAAAAQPLVDHKHDPRLDHNLSPHHNATICPEHNASINPQSNWNINPRKNGLISPEHVDQINPSKNKQLNPLVNTDLNPMFVVCLSPRFENWKGLYLFDKEDSLWGYITRYSNELLLEFDKNAEWKFFYIKTAIGTFNRFNLNGKWTGEFLCPDSMVGYNLFDNDGKWTGMHIK